MKAFCLLLLLVAGMMSSGCATPTYSGRERWQMITRNWGYEYRQMQDDIDHALLLRPASRLTIWHVR